MTHTAILTGQSSKTDAQNDKYADGGLARGSDHFVKAKAVGEAASSAALPSNITLANGISLVPLAAMKYLVPRPDAGAKNSLTNSAVTNLVTSTGGCSGEIHAGIRASGQQIFPSLKASTTSKPHRVGGRSVATIRTRTWEQRCLTSSAMYKHKKMAGPDRFRLAHGSLLKYNQ